MGPHHSGSITRTAGRKPLSMICHLMVVSLQAKLGENLSPWSVIWWWNHYKHSWEKTSPWSVIWWWNHYKHSWEKTSPWSVIWWWYHYKQSWEKTSLHDLSFDGGTITSTAGRKPPHDLSFDGGTITSTAGRKPLSMICHLMVIALQAQLGENLSLWSVIWRWT